MTQMAPVFAEGLDDICQEFLVESYENLDELDRALVALEQDPGSRPLIASIFRTIHTIKGTSGFLAFSRLESVTHVGENVLSQLRDGHLTLTPEITTTLLRLVDTVRELLGTIEASGREGEVDIDPVVALLNDVLEGRIGTAAPAPVETVTETVVVEELVVVEEDGAVEILDVVESLQVDVPFAAAQQTAQPAAPVASVALPAMPEQASYDVPEAETDARRSVADSTIRVDVGLLDQLMRMVGELVLTRNQVLQHVGDLQHIQLQRASQRLNLIATELQDGVMKTRMQPIDHIWQRLPRVVRDLGAQCGKSVELTMEGRETELDRSLLEAVKDPLTHLVRNAVDHGLEAPAVRVAAGKPAEGTLSLRAFHEGGQVVVEVADDGRGIDPAAVGAKALDKGLVTRDELAAMSERDIIDLVFRPGFSTAAEVTNVSGRGVGMDVVRTNIEKIGGTVDLSTAVGIGTTVRVRIPLTLAIIPALLVGEGGDYYAIPQLNLLELVRLDPEAAEGGIENVAGARVLRLRGRLLPLVFLHEQLGLEAPEGDVAANVVVLSSDNVQFGLVVHDIADTQEIVVRPLSRQIKHVEAFAGATITGDGRVALILDVAGLAARATAHWQSSVAARAAEAEVRVQESNTVRLLICEVGEGRRVALPMDQLARLEEFESSQIEQAGDVQVVQYRDALLEVVDLAVRLGISYGTPDRTSHPVVVHHREGGPDIGLVVESILDVVEQEVVMSSVGDRYGLLGSAVLQGIVTDVIDVAALVGSGEVLHV